MFLDEELNLKNIYCTNLTTINEIKIRDFLYKYLKRLIPTNQFLNKCKLVSSSLCDFCNMEIETLNHLFWECRHVQSFCMQSKEFLKEHNIDVTFKSITFGLQKRQDPDIKIKNFIIFTAKYFIFSNKYQKANPMWEGFKLNIEKIYIEQEIALIKNKLLDFERAWGNLKNNNIF